MSSYFVDKSSCVHHTIFPGVDIYTAHTPRLMISVVDLQPHAVVEDHSHPHDQMGILLEGDLEFTIGGERRKLSPGQMWRIPGGIQHRAVAGPRGAKAVDVFHPVREEYT